MINRGQSQPERRKRSTQDDNCSKTLDYKREGFKVQNFSVGYFRVVCRITPSREDLSLGTAVG